MARFIFFSLFFTVHLFACTDFRIMDTQGGVVAGRSMEFAVDLKSELAIHPSNEEVITYHLQNKKGLSWKSKYAYIGLTALSRKIISEGLNEKGLSFAALWFPGAHYPTIDEKSSANIIPLEELGSWVLGNFANIEEVRTEIQKIQLWSHEVPGIDRVPPLHFALHDASGKSLVIEFLKGKMKIYDNPIGVLTNAPSFTWHLTNLGNYIHLSGVNEDSINLKGTVIGPIGQGSGLLGIPGDWTPPSRFIRMVTYANLAEKAPDAKKNANLAFHLLNTVDIPYGAIRAENEELFTYTQWVAVKDLKNLILYYRTYEDSTIKSVRFSDLKMDKLEYLPINSN